MQALKGEITPTVGGRFKAAQIAETHELLSGPRLDRQARRRVALSAVNPAVVVGRSALMGWQQMGPRLRWVGERFAGGQCGYEVLTSWAGADLGYVVQVARIEARIVGRSEALHMALRVTMVFRREDGEGSCCIATPTSWWTSRRRRRSSVGGRRFRGAAGRPGRAGARPSSRNE